MKNLLFIPFKDYKVVGGPTTFMKNLKTYLEDNEYKYLDHSKKAQGIFFPIIYNLKELGNLKKKKRKIIQRLDGIYYPQKHGDNYIENNKNIKDIYLNYTNFIIFQSEYSKKQCFIMLGEKCEEEYSIINNGTNKQLFYPKKDSDKNNIHGKIKLVTTGSFRNIDMIEPVVKALDSLENKISFELNIVGPIANPEIEKYFKRDYINLHGTIKLEQIADILRSTHIFIYSHLNPPCPNSVLEAISCGIPVVGFNSGAMSELCFFSSELLAEVSNDIFQEYKDFDFKKLAEKIIYVIENYDEYRNRALKNSQLYSFEECGKKYIEVFNNQLNKKVNKHKLIKKRTKKVKN